MQRHRASDLAPAQANTPRPGRAAPRHPMLALQDRVGNRALLDAMAAGLNPLDVFPHDGALRHQLGHALPGRAVVDPTGCAARGVEAFTDGLTTHFRTATPALAVAAHEAAHQLQHADLTCDADLGPEGHAEAISHRVVAGRPAHDLIGSEGAAVTGDLHPYMMIPEAQQGPGSDLGWASPQGGGLRVSDDGHLAVPDLTDTVSQVAWASSADIAAADAVLEAQGSKLRLEAGPPELSGKAPESDGEGPALALSRVIVTEADGSQPVDLTADCGKAAYEVMGGAEQGNLGAAVVNTPQGEVTTDPHPYQSRYDDVPGTAGTTELWFREILRMAYGDLPTEELMALYLGQSVEERAAFEAQWGINEQAVPEVGEAVTTMSCKTRPAGIRPLRTGSSGTGISVPASSRVVPTTSRWRTTRARSQGAGISPCSDRRCTTSPSTTRKQLRIPLAPTTSAWSCAPRAVCTWT